MFEINKRRETKFDDLTWDWAERHLINFSVKRVINKLCLQDKPANIEMNGDTAFVRYVTTTNNNGTGWLLRWFVTPGSF